jgi:hypothetical protein
MAPKSRRNRRNISSNSSPTAAVNPAAFENKHVSAAAAKPASVESFITDANFANDLKWAGIVTLLIAVLIVVSLFVIPR